MTEPTKTPLHRNRAALEKLAVDAGHAINANGGRCGIIETVLCKLTTLCVQLVQELDGAKAAPVAGKRWRKTLAALASQAEERGADVDAAALGHAVSALDAVAGALRPVAVALHNIINVSGWPIENWEHGTSVNLSLEECRAVLAADALLRGGGTK